VQRHRRAVHHRHGEADGDGLLRLVAGAGDLQQVGPGHELHGQEQLLGGDVQVVDVGDVGVVEGGGDLRLVQEHVDQLLLGLHVREDLLEHHQLLEAGVAALERQVDRGHASGGEAAHDLVLA